MKESQSLIEPAGYLATTNGAKDQDVTHLVKNQLLEGGVRVGGCARGEEHRDSPVAEGVSGDPGWGALGSEGIFAGQNEEDLLPGLLQTQKLHGTSKPPWIESLDAGDMLGRNFPALDEQTRDPGRVARHLLQSWLSAASQEEGDNQAKTLKPGPESNRRGTGTVQRWPAPSLEVR